MPTAAFSNLLDSAVLISQGAEAKVYRANLTPGAPPVLLKYRFRKHYRHPILDATLTKARVAGEARALLKCLRSGVNVPSIRMVDAADGALGIEWIDGKSVRHLLPGGAESEARKNGEAKGKAISLDGSTADPLDEYGISVDTLMSLIGIEIAKMHAADIVHGDLTTSNMMLRHPSSFAPPDPKLPTELVLIDFGLSYHSTLVEDKAVDLYVLERAFASTHPDAEPLFASVLNAYSKRIGQEWRAIERRLNEVRLRGRKRSMVG